MKIAISCHPTQGGSGVVASELASALSLRGHEIHLVSCERPFRLRKDTSVQFHRVDVLDYPLFQYPPHDLSLANRLAGVAKEFDIEIIHAHYAVPHAVAALLARDIIRPRGIRVVTTLHGTDITLVGSHRSFYDLTRHTMLEADAVTTVSTWLCDETMRRFSLPEMPEVIPNFIDPKIFNPEGRAAYPGSGEEFHFVHASNLRPVKRIADVVRIFHLVQMQVPARLTVLGEGPDRGMAEELTAELDLSDRVAFLGMSNSMPEVLRSAHLYLLPSDHESFGLSALEAMACGTPVAGSSAGGLREIVKDNETGLLCRVGDVSGTAGRVVELLGDRKKWEAMSAAAADRAEKQFASDVVVPRYERLYEKVLEGKARR